MGLCGNLADKGHTNLTHRLVTDDHYRSIDIDWHGKITNDCHRLDTPGIYPLTFLWRLRIQH